MSDRTCTIERKEYEKGRHVFNMCKWINKKIKEMELLPDFEKDYFSQRGSIVKKLIEEAMPLAALGLWMTEPMNNVFIRCRAGYQPYDAELRVKGFSPLNIKVEVTTTQTEETVSARQQLAKTGFTRRPALPKWTPEEEEVLPLQVTDMIEQYNKWIESALESAKKKLSKEVYGTDTAILVRVDTWSPLPLNFRAILINETRSRFSHLLADVYDVFYLHGGNVDAVSGSRPRQVKAK